MSNPFERFPSLPEQEAIAPDTAPGRSEAVVESSDQHPEANNQLNKEEAKPELNEREGDAQDRVFEETAEDRERREVALAEMERNMRQLREEFAEKYVEDQAKEVEDYFATDLSQAENGEEAKKLLHVSVIDKVKAGMIDFIETGDKDSIPAIHVEMQKVVYPHQGNERTFLIGLSIRLNGGGETQEKIDSGLKNREPEDNTALRSTAA